jgi:hypothetical protein
MASRSSQAYRGDGVSALNFQDKLDILSETRLGSVAEKINMGDV